MGFDLTAKRPKRGATRYFRAGIEFMRVLRCAMLAAGVPEVLVYKKFVSNDDWLVTARQSEMISEKVTAWLRGRNLTLQLVEQNPRGQAVLKHLGWLLAALGNKRERNRIENELAAKSLIRRVDRKTRKDIREFATFSRGSGGFWVD
jgi:hypothetical protein